MIEIVKQVEIEYGTDRNLTTLFMRHNVSSDHFHLYSKHLSFRRKGKRNVEVVSLRVEERQGPQRETHTAALELLRERKLRPGTLWEASAILPRSLYGCGSVEEYNTEKETFWNQFGENISIFALGHQNPSWMGTQFAVLYSDGRYNIRYYFQSIPITSNIWYVGYRYMK